MRPIRFHLRDRVRTKTLTLGLRVYLGYGFRVFMSKFKKNGGESLENLGVITREDIIREFHKIYHDSGVIYNTSWLGVNAVKCPLDLWIYQELLYSLKPDFIIETGTRHGGTALFFACLFDIIGEGQVITIDIDSKEKVPEHKRIHRIIGNSIEPKIIEDIKNLIKNNKPNSKILVILDSDHSKNHVLKEMEIYGKFVTEGSYLIVEDTNMNGNPVLSEFGPGPMEAVNEFLKTNDQFVIDKKPEKFILTMNPSGFLKKIK